MEYVKYFFAVLAVISLNDAVRVNMQGSLSFGKDVMDSLTHYMRRNFMSGRKSLSSFSRESDVLYLVIKATYLCRDIEFCDDKLEIFLNNYIMTLTKSIETIFEEILSHDEVDEESKLVKRLIFEEELKQCLREIQKLLREADIKVKEETEIYVWTELLKKISVMFQTAAIIFASDRLEGTPSDLGVVKRKLTHKFVITTVIVEEKYVSKLCSDYNICIKNYECTKALKTVLETFVEMEEEKVKKFMRFVSDAILDTKFYSLLNEVTSNELQIILNDMAYSNSVPVKEILLSIYRTVEDRLKGLMSKSHVMEGKDVELVHAILSDLDHAYAKRKVDPFHVFLSNFYNWSRTGVKIGSQVRELMKDISDQVSELQEDLYSKLVSEVRVFLEITVDPEIENENKL